MLHIMHEYTEVDAATQLVGGTVTIDEIDDSKLDIMYIATVITCSILWLCMYMINICFAIIETQTPDMKNLHRYVITTYAPDWKAIGLELNLKASTLEIIAADNPLKCTVCFEKTLDMWLKSTPDATWRTLEIAITNVKRAQLGLKPLSDTNGEYVTINQ